MEALAERVAPLRDAAGRLKLTAVSQRNSFLQRLALRLNEESTAILAANEIDLRNYGAGTLADRLRLTETRLQSLGESVNAVANLPDPLSTELVSVRPNGLAIEKVRMPIGVVAVIYEARPNVTVDSVALCVKSGNAVLLRDSSHARETNRFLVRLCTVELERCGLPPASIVLVEERMLTPEIVQLRSLVDLARLLPALCLPNVVYSKGKLP